LATASGTKTIRKWENSLNLNMKIGVLLMKDVKRSPSGFARARGAGMHAAGRGALLHLQYKAALRFFQKRV